MDMRTLTRIYDKLQRRTKAEKQGFLYPYEENGVEGYKASVGTLTGGSVWKGGTFTSEERFFTDRQAAQNWIEERVDGGKILEVVFSDNPNDYKEAGHHANP
jgi:hypothetical protein